MKKKEEAAAQTEKAAGKNLQTRKGKGSSSAAFMEGKTLRELFAIFVKESEPSTKSLTPEQYKQLKKALATPENYLETDEYLRVSRVLTTQKLRLYSMWLLAKTQIEEANKQRLEIIALIMEEYNRVIVKYAMDITKNFTKLYLLKREHPEIEGLSSELRKPFDIDDIRDEDKQDFKTEKLEFLCDKYSQNVEAAIKLMRSVKALAVNVEATLERDNIKDLAQKGLFNSLENIKKPMPFVDLPVIIKGKDEEEEKQHQIAKACIRNWEEVEELLSKVEQYKAFPSYEEITPTPAQLEKEKNIYNV